MKKLNEKKAVEEAIKKLKWARSQCIMRGGLDDIIIQTVMLDYHYVISISEDDFDGKDLIEFCQKVKKVFESEIKRKEKK